MLSPVEISIIPNAGVVFLVPKSILNLFISDYEDIYEGIYNFIKFVEDELQPYMNQIGIDDIDELIISYELIKNNVYEIKALREDCINLDELETKFTCSTLHIDDNLLNSTDSQLSVPELYKMVEYDNIIDIISILINAGYQGKFNLLLLPNDTFIHVTNNNLRTDFVLSEFCNAVEVSKEISLDIIYSAASLVETIEIDSRGGRYRCQGIWAKKGFTRRQRAQLKKLLHKMKGFIEEKK